MKTHPLLVSMALFCFACAHHRDVRPGVGGNHSVSVLTENKEQGAREALSQAQHFCKEEDRRAAIQSEEQKYTGDLSEEDYLMGKRASKVATVLGGGAYTMGGRRESTAGGVVGLGGAAVGSALGEGYTTTMKFRCE